MGRPRTVEWTRLKERHNGPTFLFRWLRNQFHVSVIDHVCYRSRSSVPYCMGYFFSWFSLLSVYQVLVSVS